MDNNIYKIIGKLLAVFLVAICAYLAPKVKWWLETNASKEDNENIKILVDSFVKAAEQLFHDDDPTGEYRKNYVMEQLTLLNIDITSQVMNMIEGAVWEVNNRTMLATKDSIDFSDYEETYHYQENNKGNDNGNG